MNNETATSTRTRSWMHSCYRLFIHAKSRWRPIALLRTVWAQQRRSMVSEFEGHCFETMIGSLGIQNHSLYSKITSKIQIKDRKVSGMLNLLYFLYMKIKNCTEDTKDQVVNWKTNMKQFIWTKVHGCNTPAGEQIPTSKNDSINIWWIYKGRAIYNIPESTVPWSFKTLPKKNRIAKFVT